jgi:hypothetical protein
MGGKRNDDVVVAEGSGQAPDPTTPCRNWRQLWRWVAEFAGLRVPRVAVCANHRAPFDYLRAAYFEPAGDLVVWAPRGGGKTHLAAVATLLDLLHKPGCQVRILGGSLEQSLRMWEHLLPMAMERWGKALSHPPRAHRLELANGSAAAVLSQSQRSVRGLRVQKMRCDEVELFDPRVWEAVQLVTRSQPRRPHRRQNQAAERTTHAAPATGVIEALSTLHEPFGLMRRIVDEAEAAGRPVIRWCLLEVLERCPRGRHCASCALQEDCRGVAKSRCRGFVRIDDAIAMKRRVSKQIWEAEMLCRRPSQRYAVFPDFDPERHVRATVGPREALSGDLSLAMDFGFANPFVCLWIVRWDDGRTHVIDEYVQPGRQLAEHLEMIRRRPWGPAKVVACDPAGQGHSDQTGTSNVQHLRKEGFCVRCRPSGIVAGLEMIRAALAPAAGEPTLFVHPRCARLIRALESYHYAPGGSELPVKDGEHDHLIDALRYHYVNLGISRKATVGSYL